MSTRVRDSARRGGPPQKGEVYLEYRLIGGQRRVSAIDAATGAEVTVFGPASASQEELGRLAVRKLERRLSAGAGDTQAPPRGSRLV